MSAVAIGGGTVKMPLGGRRTPVRRLHTEWSPRRITSAPKTLAVSAVDPVAGRPIPRDGGSLEQQGYRGPNTAFHHVLFLSLTRELSSQILDVAKKFLFQTGVKVVVAYEGAPMNFQNALTLVIVDTKGGEDSLKCWLSSNGFPATVIRGDLTLTQALTLVFLETKQGADSLEYWLTSNGFSATAIRGDLMQTTGVKVVVAYGGAPTNFQRLASDFLSSYRFLAVGRVRSSTDLITQRVEYVSDFDMRSHLMDLLHAQRENGTNDKLRELKKGAAHGPLHDLIERATRVSLRNIKYLAIDEADSILDMGFEPQIRKIVQQRDMPPMCSLSLHSLGYQGRGSLSIGVKTRPLRLSPPRAMAGGGSGLNSYIFAGACVVSFTLTYFVGHVKYGVPVVAAVLVGVFSWTIRKLGFTRLKLEGMEAALKGGGPSFNLKVTPESALGGTVDVDLLLLTLAAFLGFAVYLMVAKTAASATEDQVKKLKEDIVVLQKRVEELQSDRENLRGKIEGYSDACYKMSRGPVKCSEECEVASVSGS